MEKTKVTMACNPKFYTFDKHTYPPVLKDYISKYDWSEIALEATRVIGNAWSEKKKNDIVSMPRKMIIASYVTVFLLIFFFITLYIYGSSKENSTYLLVLSLISIIIALLMSFILAIYNYVRKLGPMYSLSHFINIGFNTFIKSLNKRHEGRLYFKFIQHPISLECVLIHKQKKDIGAIQTDCKLNSKDN